MLTKNKCNDLINITLLFIFYSAKNSYTIAVVAKSSKISKQLSIKYSSKKQFLKRRTRNPKYF